MLFSHRSGRTAVPLPACGERSTRTQVGFTRLAHHRVPNSGKPEIGARRVRGPRRESELVEAPPHRAEPGFSTCVCGPLPVNGERKAAPVAVSGRDKDGG